MNANNSQFAVGYKVNMAFYILEGILAIAIGLFFERIHLISVIVIESVIH